MKNTAEKELDTTFATLDDIEAIVLVSNDQGEIVFANKAIERILGYTPEEVLGNGWWEVTKSPDIEARKTTTIGLISGTRDLHERHLFENPIRTKDGRIVWTQWTNTLTEDNLLVGLAQDITEKKALEEELLRKNQENELLLKEIHHRVKNNLQIITSLLNLQFRDIQDKAVLEALTKSKNRINSMALIHTKLYQSKDLASVNFGEYMHELMESIANGYGPKNAIEWSVECTDTVFHIDLAISLGLIATELISNSYKHAFVGREKGNITVSLKQLNMDTYQLVVEDDGIGIPQKHVVNEPTTLGLEIIHALTEQINGKLEMHSENGFYSQITFSI